MDSVEALDHLSLISVAHNLHYKFNEGVQDAHGLVDYARRMLKMIGYPPDDITTQAALETWQRLYPQDRVLEAPNSPQLQAPATVPQESWGYGAKESTNLIRVYHGTHRGLADTIADEGLRSRNDIANWWDPEQDPDDYTSHDVSYVTTNPERARFYAKAHAARAFTDGLIQQPVGTVFGWDVHPQMIFADPYNPTAEPDQYMVPGGLQDLPVAHREDIEFPELHDPKQLAQWRALHVGIDKWAKESMAFPPDEPSWNVAPAADPPPGMPVQEAYTYLINQGFSIMDAIEWIKGHLAPDHISIAKLAGTTPGIKIYRPWGEPDENGEYEYDPDEEYHELDPYDQENRLTEQAIDLLKNEGLTEPSASGFHEGVWYTHPDDPGPSAHLHGFLPHEQQEVYYGLQAANTYIPSFAPASHPDPWMDNEPGALTFPQKWTKSAAKNLHLNTEPTEVENPEDHWPEWGELPPDRHHNVIVDNDQVWNRTG
jgi:hypothetical protein